MKGHPVETQRYTGVAIGLHWLIVAMLVAQFAIAWTMPDIHRGTVPERLITWHLSTGVAILMVMLLRVVWRLLHTPPPAPRDLSRPLQLVSRTTHLLLYALLFVLPLLGWANASARGWSVRIFGAIPLPQLLPTASAIGRQAGNIHATLAIALLVLIGLHVSGAIYHRFVLRDRTLARMIP